MARNGILVEEAVVGSDLDLSRSNYSGELENAYLEWVSLSRPKTKVKFLCGDQQTDWVQLWATALVANNVVKDPSIDSGFLAGASRTSTKLLTLADKRTQHILHSFLETLQIFWHTKCFDPRDKVYAPLCLASDDVRYSITPDYANKTVLDVYTDVARYCLSQPEHSLDFLGYTMYQEHEQAAETPQGIRSTLPSWVPNFSASLNVVPVPKVLFVPAQPRRKGVRLIDKRGIPTNDETQISAYHPLGDIQAKSSIENATLFVCGARLDILVDKIANTRPDSELVARTAGETSTRWAIAMGYQYFTGESYLDAYKRALLLDVVYDWRERPAERGNAYDPVLNRKPQAELAQTEYLHQTSMRIALNYAGSLRDVGLSRKHYLLAIPNTAVVGDTIWALAGGQVLYVLRTVNQALNRYMFIGECYGHGLMDGEILRQLHLGETKMEDISLI